MKTTMMFLTAFLVLGGPGLGIAQQTNSKRAGEAPSIVAVPSGSEASPGLRILRLEYQLRILAWYNPGEMKVARVFAGGPATKLVMADPRRTPIRLEPGDIITHVDGTRINTMYDYYRAMYLSSARNGRVALRVRDVRTGRTFLCEGTAERVGGPRDNPERQNARRATRVKVLLIGDTADRNIGQGISKNLEGMSAYVRGLPGFDTRTDLTVLTGEITSKNVLRAVAAMRVQPTETVFCYFASHGAYDPTLSRGDLSGGHFFQLSGGGLMRRTLRGALKDRGGQLTVLISDTCNAPARYTPPPLGSMAPKPIPSKALTELLYNHVGVVDVSGSSRNQFGWYEPDGGWFTLGLLGTLNSLGPDRVVEWKDFVEQTSKNASSVFQTRKKAILATPEPTDEKGKAIRKLLRDQADQCPQVFQLKVRRVGS